MDADHLYGKKLSKIRPPHDAVEILVDVRNLDGLVVQDFAATSSLAILDLDTGTAADRSHVVEM